MSLVGSYLMLDGPDYSFWTVSIVTEKVNEFVYLCRPLWVTDYTPTPAGGFLINVADLTIDGDTTLARAQFFDTEEDLKAYVEVMIETNEPRGRVIRLVGDEGDV